MAKPVDIELKNAFSTLQRIMVESSEKVQLIDSQIEVLKRVLQHLEVTQHEIGSFPCNTKIYEPVGRLFIRANINVIKKNLKNRESKVKARALELENNKEYLEKHLKESEDNIREMVQQRKEQGENK